MQVAAAARGARGTLKYTLVVLERRRGMAARCRDFERTREISFLNCRYVVQNDLCFTFQKEFEGRESLMFDC